jgi:hypothetical protein
VTEKDHAENRPAATGSGTGAPGNGRLRRDDRFERIVAALPIGSSVRIADPAARFGVSTETLRDLDELSRRGPVDRIHGGAAPALRFHELAVDARAGRRAPAHRRKRPERGGAGRAGFRGGLGRSEKIP